MNILAPFQAIKDIIDNNCPAVQKTFKGEPKTFDGQSPVITIKFGGFTHHALAMEQATDTYSFVITLYVKWIGDELACETALITILENELAPAMADNKSLNGTVTSAILVDGDAGVRKIVGKAYRYIECMLIAYYKTE